MIAYALLLLAATAKVASSLTVLNATFTNCLASTVTTPKYTALSVDVTYDDAKYLLSYVMRGNMTGQITDVNANNTLASALTDTITVAGYTQTRLQTRLCSVSRNPLYETNSTYCPFGPGLTLLEFSTQLSSTYMFSSLTSTIRINGPTETNYEVGCVEVTITPQLSKLLKNVLTYIPLMILLVVGVKVVSVVILNPWSGTLDPFRGFSNFGLDINAMRMVTPGFSDCLAYLQFIAYSSMLSLQYPGYFHPVTSRIGWSMLAFASSPISSSINFTPQNSRSLTTYLNYVGELRQDAWKSFMIWWLIVQACTVAAVVIVLTLWWLLTPSSTELTEKNIPFLGGSVLRVYHWFLVPLTIFTSFQLLTAEQTHAAAVALSVIVFMFLIVLLPAAIFIFVPRHKPRQDLYDDLTILNLVGPLYNTVSEHALMMIVLNVTLQILRGLIVGFLVSYGTAQVALLIILEIFNFVGLLFLRPWPSKINTTLINSVISGTRLVVLMLLIPFIARISVSVGRREWIGYIILIIHAAALAFLFFGNAMLTLLELLIRLTVIVPQDEGAKVIFGARQLRSRRRKRSPVDSTVTHSMTSTNSVTGLLSSKDESPFFRAPKPTHRLSRGTMGSDLMSQSSISDVLREPSEYSGFDPVGVSRSHSYGSTELLQTRSRPLVDDDLYENMELSLAPTEDAARRGVDYAVRESDIYHPQASNELLGPSKRLGTGPADPNGVVFRKLKWAPWRKEVNPEKGKFVVVRSHPAPQRTLSTSSVAMQDLSPEAEVRSNPMSPPYDSIAEEEEEQSAPSYFRRPLQSRPEDRLQEHGIRHVVNDVAPTLPALGTVSPVSSGMAQSRSYLYSPSSEAQYPAMSPGDDHIQTSSVRSTPVRTSIRDPLLSELPRRALFDT